MTSSSGTSACDNDEKQGRVGVLDQKLVGLRHHLLLCRKLMLLDWLDTSSTSSVCGHDLLLAYGQNLWSSTALRPDQRSKHILARTIRYVDWTAAKVTVPVGFKLKAWYAGQTTQQDNIRVTWVTGEASSGTSSTCDLHSHTGCHFL